MPGAGKLKEGVGEGRCRLLQVAPAPVERQPWSVSIWSICMLDIATVKTIVPDERKYYSLVLEYSRANLMVRMSCSLCIQSTYIHTVVSVPSLRGDHQRPACDALQLLP
jgi:hypothetical protein